MVRERSIHTTHLGLWGRKFVSLTTQGVLLAGCVVGMLCHVGEATGAGRKQADAGDVPAATTQPARDPANSPLGIAGDFLTDIDVGFLPAGTAWNADLVLRDRMLPLFMAASKGDLETIRGSVKADPKWATRRCPRHNMGGAYIAVGACDGTSPYMRATEKGGALLHVAAGAGQQPVAEYLVAQGAGVNATDLTGWSVLHYIAAPPPPAPDPRWAGVMDWRDWARRMHEARRLHCAAHRDLWARRKKIAVLLLDRGARINATDSDGVTPLVIAARADNHTMAQFLLAHGAKLDIFSAVHLGMTRRVAKLLAADRSLLNKVGPGHKTPIEIAAGRGDAETVRLLLKLKADIAGRGHRVAPLARAVHSGSPRIVSMLLKAGTDPNKARLWGTPVLSAAAGRGQLDLVRMLVQSGARLHDCCVNSNVPLHMAACGGHKDVVEYLLSKGADINGGRKEGSMTPLMGAVISGQTATAKHLIARGARVDVFSAAGLGLTDRLRELLRTKPDRARQTDREPNYPYENRTGPPLHWAAKLNQVASAKVLLEFGAELDGRYGFHHAAPLHLAAADGHVEMTRFLLERGAFVDARASNELRTPLSWALWRAGNEKVVRLLLEHGANPNARKFDRRAWSGILRDIEDRPGVQPQVALVRKHTKDQPPTLNDVQDTIRTAWKGNAPQSVEWKLRATTLENGIRWSLRKGRDDILLGVNFGGQTAVNDIRSSPDGRFLAVQRGGPVYKQEFTVELVDLPRLLLNKRYHRLHRFSVSRGDGVAIVGWREGQVILASSALLSHAGANGQVPRALFMKNSQRFAVDPLTRRVNALTADAKAPVAYYLANIDNRGGLWPDGALIALKARSALPKLREMLNAAKDSYLRRRLTQLIADLERLPASAQPLPTTPSSPLPD